MRNSWVSCAALVGAVLGGCQAPADAPADRQADMQVDGQAAAASLCADDGPVFAGTTTCVGRSVNFMDQDALAALPQPRDGCDWAPQETMIGDGEALLFMGAVCKDVPTGFSYDDGKLAYASGDLFVKGQSAVVEVFDTPEDDALAPLRAMIAALPPAEQSGCVIQPYGVDGAPAGAIGIGPTAAARAAAPQDQPNAYCGAYGLNEDESNFWLVRQGKAMFFRPGQEAQDIAPGTMTLMVRDENGDWSAAPDPRGPLAECYLEVEGSVYLDGVCEANVDADGSFQVFGKDYFAYASSLDDGKFNVSWNADPANSHAAALVGEDFTEQDGCLVGANGKVCRWDLGTRPKD